jgi:hypothetical protein
LRSSFAEVPVAPVAANVLGGNAGNPGAIEAGEHGEGGHAGLDETPGLPLRDIGDAAEVIVGEPGPRIMIGVADQSLDAVSNRLSAYAALARFLRLAAAFILFAVRFHQVRF